MAGKKKAVEKADTKSTFFKEQILTSKRYSDKKDLINILLKAHKSYTLVEVDQLIEKFKTGKVK